MIELRGDLVYAVNETANATVVEFYDYVLHVRITADKTDIIADDFDFAAVTAKVYDYLGNPVNYAGDIHFNVEGDCFTMPTSDGEAAITVTSDHPNDIDISAWISNSRAGGCIIVAKDYPA